VVDAFVDNPDAPDDDKDRFAVSAATKESVPFFGPPLPPGPVFKRNDDLRRVILTKRECFFLFFSFFFPAAFFNYLFFSLPKSLTAKWPH